MVTVLSMATRTEGRSISLTEGDPILPAGPKQQGQKTPKTPMTSPAVAAGVEYPQRTNGTTQSFVTWQRRDVENIALLGCPVGSAGIKGDRISGL